MSNPTTTTPVEQLSAVQNPFELGMLRRANQSRLGKVLREVLGNIILGKLDSAKVVELTPAVDEGLAESTAIHAEAAKPTVHRRIGMTVLRDDTKSAAAYALFDAKVPDQLVRDLWAHWDINPPPNGYAAQPPHLYRNARHVLISQKFTRTWRSATRTF